MNLLHLHYFYIVAKENGFTNASKALRIQQPAISQMVKSLETNLGLKLFEKIGRNVRLTHQGLEVFEHCKKIFGAVDDFKLSIGKISGECKGPLHITASEPIASHFIPKTIAPFLKKYPQVYPNIISGPASVLFEKIISGESEFGLFFHTPELNEKLEIFEQKKVLFHLVIQKKLARKKEIIESFIGSRKIDDKSTKYFPTLDKIKKDFPKAKIKISSNNLSAHREMVLQGLGVSILPSFLVADDLKQGRLVELYPDKPFYFEMKLIKRRAAILSIAGKEWLNICLNYL